MAECRTLVQGTRLRATLIDECGAPVAGDCSTITTDGFISVSMSDNVESPDEFKVKLASGEFDINQRSRPLLNWIESAIVMSRVDPELFSLLTGNPVVYNDATPPVAVGFATRASTYATATFALELWTNIGRRPGAAVCTEDGARYGYLLLPWLIEGTLGDVTIENGPVSFTINAITSGGNDWGVGPYNVLLDNTDTPSPLLSALASDDHRLMQFTSLAPPAAVCGCQELIPVS